MNDMCESLRQIILELAEAHDLSLDNEHPLARDKIKQQILELNKLIPGSTEPLAYANPE